MKAPITRPATSEPITPNTESAPSSSHHYEAIGSMKKHLRDISMAGALAKSWVVYDPTNQDDVDKHGKFSAEDISIITLDGEEVVGCSEWMRAEREIFEHIVKLHNDSLSAS